ncbi:hypothetical protein ILYODFUR_021343 [Ilyodon furcidens]|uniref:Uncharacterized protein n=1 Tax=Ilyodon furcidens TaxID=33524 RepID=A0ABV0T9W5_9TELE
MVGWSRKWFDRLVFLHYCKCFSTSPKKTKKESSQKVKLTFCQSLHVVNPVYVHEIWIMTERMSFLHKMHWGPDKKVLYTATVPMFHSESVRPSGGMVPISSERRVHP